MTDPYRFMTYMEYISRINGVQDYIEGNISKKRLFILRENGGDVDVE